MMYITTYHFTTQKAAELARQDYDNHKQYIAGQLIHSRATGLYEFDVWKK